MASRPKRGDTEDDLLEFQEQFLASRNNPSAAVVRVNKDARDRQEQHSAVQRDVVDLQGEREFHMKYRKLIKLP